MSTITIVIDDIENSCKDGCCNNDYYRITIDGKVFTTKNNSDILSIIANNIKDKI